MFIRIVIKQLRHKWLINLLLFLTMISLVSLYVFILNTNRFTVRSMRLIMKNMGLNQLIIPEDEPASEVYLCTDRQVDFSDETTRILAGHTELLSKYYLSVLQKRIEVSGHRVLLSGIKPVKRADETREKSNPIIPVASGTARPGYAVAKMLNTKEGGLIQIMGRKFTVAEILSEQGTLDDYRLFLNLKDAQDLLGKPGKINAIYSFECLHVGGTLEHIHQWQKKALPRVLPGFRQINIANIARGRYHARRMTEKYLYYLLGIVSVITILVFVITGLQEVSDRKYETGILLAQGAGYCYIAGLYMLKTLILAILASVVGFLIGGIASVLLTTPFLIINTREVSVTWNHLPSTLALICSVALMAELIPMIKLVRMDPCGILMEE